MNLQSELSVSSRNDILKKPQLEPNLSPTWAGMERWEHKRRRMKTSDGKFSKAWAESEVDLKDMNKWRNGRMEQVFDEGKCEEKRGGKGRCEER